MFPRMILTMILREICPTASETQRKLVFEDGSTLRVWYGLVAQLSLTPDRELTEAELTLLRDNAEQSRVRERAVRILSATNVSREGLTRRLVEKGEDAEAAQAAVNWLTDLSLLDDRRTGEQLVESALRKGYGALRIRQILREKQIPEDICELLLSQLPPADEAIDRLLKKKLKSGSPDEKEQKRVVDALLRYGHSWEDIRAGLRRYAQSLEMEEEIWQ